MYIVPINYIQGLLTLKGTKPFLLLERPEAGEPKEDFVTMYNVLELDPLVNPYCFAGCAGDTALDPNELQCNKPHPRRLRNVRRDRPNRRNS